MTLLRRRRQKSLHDVITWTCHVCGEERPDRLISVHKHDRSEEKGLPPGSYIENVRYCNDSYECVALAPTIRFT